MIHTRRSVPKIPKGQIGSGVKLAVSSGITASSGKA